jgi:serine acetyltransferase
MTPEEPVSWSDTRRAIRADRVANPQNPKSRFVLTSYRRAHYFAVRKHRNRLVWLLGMPAMIWHRFIVEWVLGVELPARVQAGEGLVLWHGQGLVLNPRVALGRGVVLRQNTTIGPVVRDGMNGDAPVLEDGVDVGANVVIIGPVRVGAGAVIGAGSVVTRDVAAGSTVVGNPARPVGENRDRAHG